jgi:ABC-type enterochelin transport system permease subunit
VSVREWTWKIAVPCVVVGGLVLHMSLNTSGTLQKVGTVLGGVYFIGLILLKRHLDKRYSGD